MPDPNFGAEEFAAAAGVSRETLGRLARYAELLQNWNSRHNLVSPRSLEDLWRRHFWDSAQLAPLVFECADTDAAAQSLVQEIGQEIEDMALALDPGLQLPIVLLGSIGLRMASRLAPALRARLVEPAGDAVDGAHRLVRQQMKEAVAKFPGEDWAKLAARVGCPVQVVRSPEGAIRITASAA